MFDYPIAQASPLVNAFAQTLLLLIFPLTIASVLGGSLGLWLFFKRHPLLMGSTKCRTYAARPAPCIRSLGYIGLLPLILVLLRRLPGLTDSTAVTLLLSIGATVHFAFHVYSELYALDVSLLEMALSSGLSHRAIIRRVLLPAGRRRLVHALLETALFLLALGAVAGCVTNTGLAGLAVYASSIESDGLQWLGCLLLFSPLFLLAAWLSSRYAAKAE